MDTAYAKTKPSKTMAKSKNTAMDSVGDTGEIVPHNAGGSETVATDDMTKRAASQGNRRYVQMTHYDDMSNY